MRTVYKALADSLTELRSLRRTPPLWRLESPSGSLQRGTGGWSPEVRDLTGETKQTKKETKKKLDSSKHWDL